MEPRVVPFESLDLRALYALMHLRELVFVVGQGICSLTEVDGEDPRASHVLLYGILPRAELRGEAAGEASLEALRHPSEPELFLVGSARVFLGESPARVGRVAVHPAVQRRGLGRQVMGAVHALLGERPATMHAQSHLEGWYGSMGWRRAGEPFTEAGIPHLPLAR